MDNGRFQIAENRVLDTKTGMVYLHLINNGGYSKIKRVEKDDWYESLKITELPR